RRPSSKGSRRRGRRGSDASARVTVSAIIEPHISSSDSHRFLRQRCAIFVANPTCNRLPSLIFPLTQFTWQSILTAAHIQHPREKTDEKAALNRWPVCQRIVGLGGDSV